jgi:cytidine deaminase
MKQHYDFSYEVHDDITDLTEADRQLVQRAREATKNAYVPYSNFQVGSAIELQNGVIVDGSNQENASFPVGLCAERVALSAVSAIHPGVPIKTLAVSYNNLNGSSNRPISPCGMCRQAIGEYEERFHQPIRLILAGMEGKIYVLEKASYLLPLAFTSSDMT